MRDIVGNVRMTARYFPGEPETVSNVFHVEIQLAARQLFGEGLYPAEVVAALKGEVPGLGEKDPAGLLRLVLEEWRLFRLERGGGHVRNGTGGAPGK